jgi:hypothetical protein
MFGSFKNETFNQVPEGLLLERQDKFKTVTNIEWDTDGKHE